MDTCIVFWVLYIAPDDFSTPSGAREIRWGMSPNHPTDTPAPKIHLTTLGCAKNLVDSERMLGRLASAGALVGATPEDADILIVNTCGFIDSAKQESIEAILDAVRTKQDEGQKRVLVMGCLAQRYAEQLRAEIPEADGVFGLDEQAAVVAACGLRPADDAGRLLLTPPHTAYLRISDGCDNRCSYCTIPMIRGPLRSRPSEEILDEVRDLSSYGVRELVVIGQDTTSYGADRPGELRIHELLDRISRIEGPRWIRLLYAHPAHFTDELIDAYATIPTLCAYVDLPLQHANNGILSQMGRRTTQADCLERIDNLRRRVPNVTIRTTFIVGFPGETRRTFAQLLRFVRAVRFDHVGAFAYSEEEETPAAALPNQVPRRVRQRRRRRLMLAQRRIAYQNAASRRGQTVEVLIDRPTATADQWIGRTVGQAPDVDPVTIVTGSGLHPGQFVYARITNSSGYDTLAVASEQGMTNAL